MERMTTKRPDGRWAIANCDNASPMEQTMKIPMAIARLAAYEDTGLEPEEVDQIRRAAEHMMFDNVADFVRYSISNFEELMEYRKAEAEGRFVVLKMKYRGQDGRRALQKAGLMVNTTNNGIHRYIFDAVAEKLVREEAEAALKGEAK